GIGIAGGDEGDEAAAPRRLQLGEAPCDASGIGLAHSLVPSALATVKMSLSPRPQRFMQMMWFSGSPGAIFATCANACDGSSAGMIPSVRDSSWNAASASLSVADTYFTRPMSLSQECSGPIPGLPRPAEIEGVPVLAPPPSVRRQ